VQSTKQWRQPAVMYVMQPCSDARHLKASYALQGIYSIRCLLCLCVIGTARSGATMAASARARSASLHTL
jgi:TctA family transporter